MRLEPLTEVKLGDLAWGMAIVSANDAAVAIAEHISGTVDAFVLRMNEQAQKLGMKNTTFINPNGLPGEGGFTTARDMAILAHTYIFRFPWTLEAIHSQPSFTYNNISYPNRNRLLGKYPEVDGLKTGFTRASGYHIIVTAMKGAERHIIVVMGAGEPTKRNQEASLLLDEVLEKPPPLVTIEPADSQNQKNQVTPRKKAAPVTVKATGKVTGKAKVSAKKGR
jgi:D-alanyl-D-alanine carboxypeptidase (penicillin-binding protein 5/6)